MSNEQFNVQALLRASLDRSTFKAHLDSLKQKCAVEKAEAAKVAQAKAQVAAKNANATSKKQAVDEKRQAQRAKLKALIAAKRS